MHTAFRTTIVAFLLILMSMVWGFRAALAETRVLFVGNSVSYYHGLPYVFAEVASDLYDTDVQVDTWAQAGGVLSQAASQESVMSQLAADPYDVVVLQEWGSLLMCSRADEPDWSDRCRTSLDSHESIIASAAKSDAVTILLGTNQMLPDVMIALDEGERRMQVRAGIDAHVPYGRLLLEGQNQYAAIPWLDADGGHPGPGAVLLMACRVAEEVFDSERAPLSELNYFEPPRYPNPSLSYQSLTVGTQAFVTETPHVLNEGEIENVFELCESQDLAPIHG